MSSNRINRRRWIVLVALMASLAALLIWPRAARPADPPLPFGFEAARDVEYVAGGGKEQSLDLFYAPHGDKPLALIVFIHGGGWSSGDKAESPALWFAFNGFAVANINYRLIQTAKWPAQIQDCQAAIRWLRANSKKYKLDPDRIGVWGGSAGGHLAAMVGTTGGKKSFPAVGENKEQSDRVQAVCDWNGPTDFNQFDAQAPPNEILKAAAPNSLVAALLGGPLADRQAAAQSANPIHFIDKNDPPFLILHGDADNIVPVGQSKILADALKQAGVEVIYQPLPGDGHNLNINRPGFLDLHLAFFNRHLKGMKVEIKPIVGTMP